MQLDATRRGGYTGWLRGASSAQARNLEVSAHCAAPRVPVAAAVPNARSRVRAGQARVNPTAPGHRMTFNPAATARRVR
jgi:L-alanine-DL-glutamate epimerase-like enolase superfamily enzyme